VSSSTSATNPAGQPSSIARSRNAYWRAADSTLRSTCPTLKYRPEFPARFDSIKHARAHCRAFVDWYNHEHRHSGIGLMTPAAVHHGQAPQLHAARACGLDTAYARHPERFVGKPQAPPELPTAAWINKPVRRAPARTPCSRPSAC
jgi:hypothetical protein